MTQPGFETVGDGIARVAWTRGDEHLHLGAAIETMRRVIDDALTRHHRVEMLVQVGDELGQRVATWSGMRREGVMRGSDTSPGATADDGSPGDHIVFARLSTDAPASDPTGFRALLNSFLPRKRAIGQLLVRDLDHRVLLCQLTYKRDWDLPGGVVEVGESPRLAVAREVQEELGLTIAAGELLLTDWLPPWAGWDDAVCLVFDGGIHDAGILGQQRLQEREIHAVEFCTLDQVDERCADFTARRIRAALDPRSPGYTESGR